MNPEQLVGRFIAATGPTGAVFEGQVLAYVPEPCLLITRVSGDTMAVVLSMKIEVKQ